MVSDDMFSAEAGEKEKPVVVSLVATSDQGAAAVFRKLFKKAWAKTLHVAEFHSNFPFIKVLWRHPFFQERWQNSSYKSNLHYLIWSIFSADNAFSFDAKGPKEKGLQKEKPVVISLVATSDQGAAFGNRKLFKKSLSKNFARGIVLTQAFPSLKFFAPLSRKKVAKILTQANFNS